MQVTLSVFKEAIVAANAIAPRNQISADDLEVRRIDISNSRGAAYSRMNDVVGMTAKSYIQAGQIITANQITPPTLIKRGETISLIAQSKNFQIKTVAIAQQDGKAGQIIRVKNVASKKTVEARVLASGKAEVIF